LDEQMRKKDISVISKTIISTNPLSN